MNERIHFGQPIEPPILIAELPFDFSTNSVYNTKRISENAPFQVYMLPSVSKMIWEHVNSSRKLECSGVLVGQPFKITDGSITFVMVVGAVSHGTTRRSVGHVTVGTEEIAETRKVLDRDYPGLIPVGWYHSHPGHGIFLSGQDMVIVRSIYNLSWHIALVVDPIHDTAGVFAGGKAERIPGWMELKDDEKVGWKEWVINQSANETPSDSPPPASRADAQNIYPPNDKIINDTDSQTGTPLTTNPINTVANSVPKSEAQLDQELAERDLQQARASLENGDEVEASRLIYTLKRKHPKFRTDDVRKLSKQVEKLKKQPRDTSMIEKNPSSQPLPPHANPHLNTTADD